MGSLKKHDFIDYMLVSAITDRDIGLLFFYYKREQFCLAFPQNFLLNPKNMMWYDIASFYGLCLELQWILINGC